MGRGSSTKLEPLICAAILKRYLGGCGGPRFCLGVKGNWKFSGGVLRGSIKRDQTPHNSRALMLPASGLVTAVGEHSNAETSEWKKFYTRSYRTDPVLPHALNRDRPITGRSDRFWNPPRFSKANEVGRCKLGTKRNLVHAPFPCGTDICCDNGSYLGCADRVATHHIPHSSERECKG